MENNLKFDKEEEFGLGITAFIVSLTNLSAVNNNSFLIFDASGVNRQLVAVGGDKDPNSAEQSGSTIDLDVLKSTTKSYPIHVKKILYRVNSGDVNRQFGEMGFDITKANIDGSVIRAGDIQPNFLKRNWMYQDNLVEMEGDLTIDGNTAFIIGVGKSTTIELTFILK